MNQVTARALPQVAHFVALPHLVALPSFDLARVTARVASEHADWSSDRVQQAENGYRMFLAKAKADRRGKHVPTPDVDEVWHAHILFTKQYHMDCNNYLGYYFHHEPFDKPTHKAGSCQGGDCGADSCTSCGAGTIEAKTKSERCCGTGCVNSCGGCCESGGCSGGPHVSTASANTKLVESDNSSSSPLLRAKGSPDKVH